MRVPLPTPSVLRRQDLQGEAQERLSELEPLAVARLGDPTDPGWLLVEEAAWRAETLSAAAGTYGDGLTLSLMASFGVHLRPATPALGMVSVDAEEHGTLERGEDEDGTVFLTPESESLASVRMVMLEAQVPLVAGALEGGLITLDPVPTRRVSLRVVLRLAPGARTTTKAKAGESPLRTSVAWRLERGAGADVLEAIQVEVPAGVRVVALQFSGHTPGACFLNPALVLNAPRTADGRAVWLPIRGPGRLDPLTGAPLSPASLAPHLGRGAQIDDLLDRLPLTCATSADDRIKISIDFDDTNACLLLFRDRGEGASEQAILRWLRQTDGARGNVEADLVRIVAQKEEVRPRLRGVTNPFPITGGRDRERDADAMARIYGAGLTPLGEFEARMTEALARAGLPWHVRLWSEADWRLHEVRSWDELRTVTGEAASAEGSIIRELLQAGTLLAAVGPLTGTASETEQARARALLIAWFDAHRVPHPGLRKLHVLPLRRLSLRTTLSSWSPALPSFIVPGTSDADWLEDAHGERRRADVRALLLDGAITQIAPVGGP